MLRTFQNLYYNNIHCKLQGRHLAYKVFSKLCFSGNSYEYLEDLVSLEHNWGSDSPDEIERLKILREGKAEELKVGKSNRGEAMRAIFKRTINSNIDNPSSYFQSIVCVRYSFLSIKSSMQEVLELSSFYE